VLPRTISKLVVLGVGGAPGATGFFWMTSIGSWDC
jgi:hypothetical protein